MIDFARAFVVPAALSILPDGMTSQAAGAMLLAIGLQESRFMDRRQKDGGPARSFWQFEPGDLSGFAGVFRHASTRNHAREVCRRLRYPLPPTDLEALRRATEHNDVLAGAIARLLLWTLPAALPRQDQAAEGWAQYLQTWRPGKPHPETWDAFYKEAWDRVTLP